MNRFVVMLGAWLLLTGWGSPAGADELEEGKKLFKVKCYICHTGNDPYETAAGAAGPNRVNYTGPARGWLVPVQNRYGPDLRGVFNAPAGRRSKEGYVHSPAFQEAAPRIVWTEEKLHKWLIKTWDFIPGTWMWLRVPDPLERKRIISFLEQYR